MAQKATNLVPTDISGFQRRYRERSEGEFPSTLSVDLTKVWDLKYGENPNQHGAMYTLQAINDLNAGTLAGLVNVHSVRSDGQGKGGPSLTNTMDITRAMDNLKWFDVPSVVIMKHNIVAGFAKQVHGEETAELFRKARDADLRSNFGGTAVFNRPLDMRTAQALYELRGASPFFVDVLAAPGYEEGVLAYVEGQSKNIRIAEFSAEGLQKLPKFQGDETHGLLSLKEMPGGYIGVQDVYLTSIRGPQDLVLRPQVTDKGGKAHTIDYVPTERELDDLVTAWWLNITGARSNGVVFVKDGVTVAMGSGQVERVGAVEQAIVKGMQKAMNREGVKYNPLHGMQGSYRLKKNPFEGAVCSSDAFFPFPDSVDQLAKAGVTAVVQPYGSLLDGASIDAANKYKMAMPATGERCFGHF
jgi:phosphoribosylaminoimidazolecarboxamide formyltransferase/IMP cyclohydrolase